MAMARFESRTPIYVPHNLRLIDLYQSYLEVNRAETAEDPVGANPSDPCRRNLRLIDLYQSYFEVRRAETAADLAAAFRLRYDVYCVENPFEDPDANPVGLETDAYDATALHSLLLHRPTGEIVGTVRLILPSWGKSGMGLPLREICDHGFLGRDNATLPWTSTAEISRFAVSKRLRQRTTDRRAAIGEFPLEHDARRRSPDTSLGLMQAVIAMASAAGVTHLCAAMEPALLRMLRRLGMQFYSLGPEIEYHGRRQPCYVDLDSGLAKTWLQRPEVWEFLTCAGELWPLNRDLATDLRKGRANTPNEWVAAQA
jgi:N-acyl amino acid synthase of PEP-CTERM/exosortase system